MSVFRRKVRGKPSRWMASFVFAKKLYREYGFHTKGDAQDWEDTERAALRRGKSAYVKVLRSAPVLPLIDAYVDEMLKLGRDEKYASNCLTRLRRLQAECPWMNLGDLLDASKLDAWRSGSPKSSHTGKALAPKTLNQYVDHAAELGKWLVDKKHIPLNPFEGIKHLHAPRNRGYRRAASAQELRALMTKAPPDRAFFYRFAIYVPLRRAAFDGLEWRDLNLKAERPTLTVRAELAKNGQESRLGLRKDLAEELGRRRGDAADDDKVLPVVPRVRELKADLIAAGIAFDDGKGGRRLDLHAFRKTAIRLLKEAGVSLDDAHVLLQHLDRKTTEQGYDDDMVEPRILDAAERMPAFAESTASNVPETCGEVGAQLSAQATNRTEEPE